MDYIVGRDISKFNNGYLLPTHLLAKIPHRGNSTQMINERGNFNKQP